MFGQGVDEGLGDEVGEAHHQVEAGVLQDEVLHKAADVDHADDVKAADGGRLLWTPVPGLKGPGLTQTVPTFSDRPRQASTATTSLSWPASRRASRRSERLAAWTGLSSVPWTINRGCRILLSCVPTRGPERLPSSGRCRRRRW